MRVARGVKMASKTPMSDQPLQGGSSVPRSPAVGVPNGPDAPPALASAMAYCGLQPVQPSCVIGQDVVQRFRWQQFGLEQLGCRPREGAVTVRIVGGEHHRARKAGRHSVEARFYSSAETKHWRAKYSDGFM